MPSVIRTVAILRSAWAWVAKRWVPVGALTIGVAAFVGLAYVVLKLAPDWFADSKGLEARDRADARQGVRTAALALLGGALAVVGSVYTARTFAHNRSEAERTFALNRAGQITDRFTKAIEQLGHTAIDVRLGGIYALERIAKDSKHDHPQIVEVLTAYVREHAPRSRAHEHEHERAERDVTTETPEEPARLATDVQAALTVLGRRAVEHEKDLPPALNLAATRLRRAELSNANLGGARLFDADLGKAVLFRANLCGAYLSKADLSGARLQAANLSGADFSKANLSDADLSEADLFAATFDKANLRGAKLRGAELRGAVLTGADLSEAQLGGADLSVAFLRGANLSGANLSGANLSGANLSRADLFVANLDRANLRGADLGGAKLRGADLSEADVSEADLSNADLSDADLSEANFSEVNLRGATIDRARWPKGFDAAAAVREGEEEPTGGDGS